MAPNKSSKSPSRNHSHKKCQLGVVQDEEVVNNNKENVPILKEDDPIPEIVVPFKAKIVLRSTGLLILVHLMGLYGAYLLLAGHVSLKTFLVAWVFGMLSAVGTTAGAHRLWAHKSFKAKFPLQLFLALCQTVACQNSIYEWSRDHRVHHKYSETDADPHNAKRGFFFAHMGWLMVKKHPEVKERGRSVDMSDLEADPLVMFQYKYYIPLILVCSFVVPCWVVWMSGEEFATSFFVTMLRYILSLHFTWSVNSFAHFWGAKPYDMSINPAENVWVSIITWGEGMHNYHHCFPWDYKASELGLYRFNLTALFIDICAQFGLAYGRKTVSNDVIQSRLKRTGDPTQSGFRH